MTAAALIRQDDGAVLILDGATRAIIDPALAVYDHPYQTRVAAVDHVQRLAVRVALDVTVSETPTIPGLTYGAARLAEVRDFLDAGVARLLTLQIPGEDPIEDLLLSALPRELSATSGGGFVARLAFVEARFARSRTVGLAPAPRPTRAGLSGGDDEGAGAAEEVRNQSLISAGIQAARDGLDALFGGAP